MAALAGLRSERGRPSGRAADARRLWRRLLRIGIQLGLASTALALVTRIPTFVLGNSGSAEDLAWFSAGQRLADAVLALATTAGFALLPSLTLFLFESERDRAWAFSRALTLGAAAAAGGAGGLLAAVWVLLPNKLVTAAFGSDFSDAADPTRILMGRRTGVCGDRDRVVRAGGRGTRAASARGACGGRPCTARARPLAGAGALTTATMGVRRRRISSR